MRAGDHYIRGVPHQEPMKSVDDLSPATTERANGGAPILVVDDETAVRRFAVRVLRREGYEVAEATDGVEALEVVRARAGSFAVVVSDIVMPRLNGVELLQALAESYSYLPVILISGYATSALAELGIATPCGILPKPFPAERLLAEVQRCIRRPG